MLGIHNAAKQNEAERGILVVRKWIFRRIKASSNIGHEGIWCLFVSFFRKFDMLCKLLFWLYFRCVEASLFLEIQAHFFSVNGKMVAFTMHNLLQTECYREVKSTGMAQVWMRSTPWIGRKDFRGFFFGCAPNNISKLCEIFLINLLYVGIREKSKEDTKCLMRI